MLNLHVLSIRTQVIPCNILETRRKINKNNINNKNVYKFLIMKTFYENIHFSDSINTRSSVKKHPNQIRLSVL